MSANPHYDLKTVRLPRLSGIVLRMVIWLLECPWTCWILRGYLLREAGLTKLRRYAISEPPSFQPEFPSASMPAATGFPTEATGTALSAGSGKDTPTLTGFATIADYGRAYRSGATTPEEVANNVLAAIADSEAREPAMKIFVAWDQADILAQARMAGRRLQQGEPLGPLDGVPVAVKDEIDQQGYPTTLGTRFLGGAPVAEDAAVVTRLRAAGAILIGKTNMHELGIGVTGFNPHYGTPRNPYASEHYTGGSSGGSAAAVAAGLCPVAIGADGGGSIRIPSAFCGVVGLKPTYGRISRFGTMGLGCTVCHIGPLGGTARDVAVVYENLAGADSRDPDSCRQPAVMGFDGANPELGRLTLGVYRPWFEHGSPEVVGVCEKLLQRLRDRGAQVREITLPELDLGRIAHAVTITSGAATALEPYYSARRREMGLDVRINIALARFLSARDYVKAQQVRARMSGHFLRALQAVDVIVTPTVACTAPPIPADTLSQGDSDIGLLTEIMRFVVPANLTGLPAISFPAGYDRQGLPVGFQAIGRPWEEHVLLKLAQAAEDLVERRLPAQGYYHVLQGSGRP